MKHEEQCNTNPKAIILVNYNASVPFNILGLQNSKIVVASYELNYLKGRVIGLGIIQIML
jgi:hypothetical protein